MNVVLAAILVYGIVFLHAHAVRNDRRHARGHRRSLRLSEAERARERLAA